MNFGTVSQNFPALLKTPDGKILEYGTASVFCEEQALDFTGEFVPICKMGTPLQVIRVQEDFETQRFSGVVYLSSPRMLRLVSLEDEVLPGALLAYDYDTALNACVTASVLQEPIRKHFSLLRRQCDPAPKLQEFPVKITSVSLARINFVCNKTLAMKQRVTLNADGPLHLESLHMEIERPVIFGPSETSSYLCRIRNLSAPNYSALSEFVSTISTREIKLFPPVVTSSEEAPP